MFLLGLCHWRIYPDIFFFVYLMNLLRFIMKFPNTFWKINRNVFSISIILIFSLALSSRLFYTGCYSAREITKLIHHYPYINCVYPERDSYDKISIHSIKHKFSLFSPGCRRTSFNCLRARKIFRAQREDIWASFHAR